MDYKVKIVMYHYVRKIAGSEYPGIKGLEYELFREQIAWLTKQFSIITIEDVLEQLDNDKPILPDNACLLTFDDGYVDHYEYAFPLLKKHKVQGSFFIPGRTIAENKVLDVNKIHFILAGGEIRNIMDRLFRILDRYRKNGWGGVSDEELFRKLAVSERFDSKEVIFVKRLLQNELPEWMRNEITSELFQECVKMPEEEFSRRLYMNPEQLKEMREAGMYIGTHGYKHNWLGEIGEEEMRQDIDASLNALSEWIDPDCWVMNYPYGSCSQAVVDYISNKGCKMAVVTEVAAASLQRGTADRYRLPRFDTNDFPPKSEKYKEY